jgi:hypothetical protein
LGHAWPSTTDAERGKGEKGATCEKREGWRRRVRRRERIVVARVYFVYIVEIGKQAKVGLKMDIYTGLGLINRDRPHKESASKNNGSHFQPLLIDL